MPHTYLLSKTYTWRDFLTNTVFGGTYTNQRKGVRTRTLAVKKYQCLPNHKNIVTDCRDLRLLLRGMAADDARSFGARFGRNVAKRIDRRGRPKHVPQMLVF